MSGSGNVRLARQRKIRQRFGHWPCRGLCSWPHRRPDVRVRRRRARRRRRSPRPPRPRLRRLPLPRPRPRPRRPPPSPSPRRTARTRTSGGGAAQEGRCHRPRLITRPPIRRRSTPTSARSISTCLTRRRPAPSTPSCTWRPQTTSTPPSATGCPTATAFTCCSAATRPPRLAEAVLLIANRLEPADLGMNSPVRTCPRGLLAGSVTYKAGTVAMANSGAATPMGASSSSCSRTRTLGPDYTPFGTITSGLDILQKVANAGTSCTIRGPAVVSRRRKSSSTA